MPLAIVYAQATLKKCAALYNKQKGKLDAHIADAIMSAADEVTGGKLDQHFPLVIYQTGEYLYRIRSRSSVVYYV